ncbi:MAG: hypothetical protein Q9201_007360, partial [Fulgogasparrea decipioides]
GRDEATEKNKLKKAIQQNHPDIAKIYAQNAIRKQNERLNLLRLGSNGEYGGGGEGNGWGDEGDGFGEVMDKFESQFEDLDVATGYYENATSSATAVGTPQDDVDRLIGQVADEAGVELQAEMKAPESGLKVGANAEEEREEELGERLRALRN